MDGSKRLGILLAVAVAAVVLGLCYWGWKSATSSADDLERQEQRKQEDLQKLSRPTEPSP
jgi:hypothetical protein